MYLVGSTTDGFTPELGQTALVAYGADDALLLKLVWGRAAARCFRGSACEASISSGIGLQDDQAKLRCPP